MHLWYFIATFPFLSLGFVLMPVSHRATHRVALTRQFLDLQSELDQETNLALAYNTYTMPKSTAKTASDQTRLQGIAQQHVSSLKTIYWSTADDFQQQSLLKPKFSKAPIRTQKSDSTGQSTWEHV